MRLALSLLLAMVLTPIVSVPAAHAQDAAVYVVSYIDVAPAARGTAVDALRKLATASRKDDGNMRYQILQRVAPSNQFAIVAVWKDQKAYEAHLAAAHSKEFRDKIKPSLISAIDDRVHTGMETGAGAATGAGPIYVVTHVDVPPPRKDECIAALKTLVAESRKEIGALRFEVFQQATGRTTSRWWKSGKINAPTTVTSRRPHTRQFRDQLTPMSGRCTTSGCTGRCDGDRARRGGGAAICLLVKGMPFTLPVHDPDAAPGILDHDARGGRRGGRAAARNPVALRGRHGAGLSARPAGHPARAVGHEPAARDAGDRRLSSSSALSSLVVLTTPIIVRELAYFIEQFSASMSASCTRLPPIRAGPGSARSSARASATPRNRSASSPPGGRLARHLPALGVVQRTGPDRRCSRWRS